MLRRMASFFGNSQFAMDTHRKRFDNRLYYILMYFS